MRILKGAKGIEVAVWSSGKEAIVNRYTDFNKYLLLDAGIGSDMESVSKHFGRLYEFLGADRKEEAMTEAQNLHYNIFSIIESINYTAMAFACMVHSIGGEIQTDHTEEGLKRIIDRISHLGFTQQQVEEVTEDIKKKSSKN